ncbi:MAG: DNA polymerase I [Patescibacteria group bacterium]|nr:DNA polymerase I [Patescibacteria group bacterium]
MPKKSKKTLVLIDSNALIHRAFHALPPLTTKGGKPSGAVYGVALTLLSVFEKFKPDYVIAAFDLKGKTFRHEKFKEYKAKRVKAPDELYEQIPVVKEMMGAFGIPVYEKKGFEADDVIGTISKDKKLDGDIERIIVTGDMDTLQLVDDDTKVFTLRRGIKDTFIFDENQVRNRFELNPDQIVDYKALRGDPSDNIPGVAGVGEKTATELLKKYKTLDGVYGNIEEIVPEGVKNKLKKGEDDAYLSQELAEIQLDVPVDFQLEDALADDPEGNENLIEFFSEMGFHSLVKRVGGGDKTQKQFSNQVTIELVEDKTGVEKIVKEIKKEKKFSYCLLTDGDKFFESKISGFGVSVDGNKSFFVDVMYENSLKSLFEDESIEKIGFNVKFDLEMLAKKWLSGDDGEKLSENLYSDESVWQSNVFDVQIGAYLLGLNAAELSKLILSEFGAELQNTNSFSGQANLLAGTDESKKKDVAERASWVLRSALDVRERMNKISKQQAKDATLGNIWEKMEKSVVSILAKMEVAGMKVDKNILKKVSELAQKEIGELKKKIHDLAGEEFNINSPSQIAQILFEKLKIPTIDIKKGKTCFSTNAEQLAKIRDAHPIVPLIEKYREFFKMKSTYADSLPDLVESDGRIHAHFNQAVAATGRLSSSDPNMQNIPKRGKFADLMRQAFVADKGKILVSADYSQIDLRVAAHLSEDEKMVEIFKNGKDIHTSTAAWVNEVSEKEIDKVKRNEAKSLNFGILYGMGQYGFMRDSGVSGERAKFFIEHYKKTFAGLTQFIEKTKEDARKSGFVETELGRRRYVPNIKASNAMIRGAAERVAVNLPVQGLAADIMKLSMIAAEEHLKKINKEKTVAKMILQIHDELVFEVDENLEKEFSSAIKKVMESVYELCVPLTVDVTSGKNWKEL